MLENPIRRLSKIECGMFLAYGLACRGTCPRARVGCLLMDKNGYHIATGYNGSAPGAPHCDDVQCELKDGHCVRVKAHAEKNALKRAKKFGAYRRLKDGYAFTTIRPCNSSHCFDDLAISGIKNIIYFEEYNANLVSAHQEKVCQKKGIILEKFNLDIVELIQKTLDFHQGPGGLLTGKNKLRIVEDIPEMMDH
ncbi:MAG: dCMP deaminase [Candidatus Harrisonbacteria bacterium]|nr:dCMP deaminase [Candidatus Harrisonbacteria bacterium]